MSVEFGKMTSGPTESRLPYRNCKIEHLRGQIDFRHLNIYWKIDTGRKQSNRVNYSYAVRLGGRLRRWAGRLSPAELP